MPLVAGRDFTDADRAGAPLVAVVNETFAQYFFGNRDPLGRRFEIDRQPTPLTIVGVVRDGKQASMRDKAIRFAYVPYMQSPTLGQVTF